jgi:type I restriction enzyme, S subunit
LQQLSKFKNTELWEIPEEWKIMRLIDISVKGIRNGIFKRREDFGEGVPLVNVSDLFSGYEIHTSKLERVRVSKEELKQFRLEEGDLFFCRSSLVADGIGQTSIVNYLPEPAVFECHVMMVRPNKNYVNPKFLSYYTHSHFTKRFLLSIAMTLTMTTIRQPDLERLPIIMPPLKEQQKIASILSNVDELIQKTDQIIEQTQRLKKGLMQRLLTKGIGHTKFKKTEFGEIPEKWDMLKIAELIKDKEGIKTGPFGSSLKKEIFVARGYKIYGQENVIPDDFKRGDYYIPEHVFLKMQKYEIKPGDVLISLVGTHGKISLVPEGIKRGIINPRLLRIRLDVSKTLPEFMKILLESIFIQKQIQNLTHGLTMGVINTEVIKQLVFFVPELSEQEKIIGIIRNINMLLKRQGFHMESLRSLKKGLMQQLLTGKIRVKV